MNIYPQQPDPGGPHAPADWTMSIDAEKGGEAVHYFADLSQAGKHVCRLALSGPAKSEEEARRLLAVKARIWIDDYLSRSPGEGAESGP